MDRGHAAHGHLRAAGDGARGRALRAALRHRRRAAARTSAARTSSCCPTARSTSRACCSRRWRSASRCCSATSAASPRWPPPAPRARSPPATPRALHDALRELLGDPAALAAAAAARARAAAGPYSWDEIGRAHARALRRSCCDEGRRPMTLGAGDRLLAVLRADRVDAARLRRRAGVLARVLARPADRAARTHRGARSRAPPAPALSLIVAAHDEESVIAAKVHNALALDYPRELLEVIVACDGCERRDRRAGQAGGRRPRARAAARRQDPRAGRRRASARAARSSPSPTPTRCGSPTPHASSWARSRTRASATPAARSASCTAPTPTARRRTPNQEGVYWRYELAVRALESRLSSITAGNGAIYATRRDSYIVVDPIMGHDLSLPFNMVKRGLRAVYVPGARAQREDGPVARRRVRAQAAHDEPHLADRPARRHALPARLPARLRADDPLPPPAALRHAGLHAARARRQHRARSALGGGGGRTCTSSRSPAAGAAARRRARRRAARCGRC